MEKKRTVAFKREFIALLKKYDLELYSEIGCYDDEANAFIGLKGPDIEDCGFIELSEYDGNILFTGDENTPVLNF